MKKRTWPSISVVLRMLLVPAAAAAVLVCFAFAAHAVEVGGQVDIVWSGVYLDGKQMNHGLSESVTLEPFLPPLGESELVWEFLLTKPVQGMFSGHKASYFTKKFYIKRRFEQMHVTVGRQPISWSFGSLLNPVDYTLGAAVLGEESRGKYTDAVELYYPLDWNSGLEFVCSFPEGITKDTELLKWGARGRFDIKGFDITANYVQEAGNVGSVGWGNSAAGAPVFYGSLFSQVFPKSRVGVSWKGDLGNFGVYGALGRHLADKPGAARMACLLGADYSHQVDYFTKVTAGIEYLLVQLDGIPVKTKRAILGQGFSDNVLHLLSGSLDYPVDDFSAAVLLIIANLNDGSCFISPSYRSIIGNDIELTLTAGLYRGGENTFFGQGGNMPGGILSLGLSYAF